MCRTWGQYVVSMLYDVICSRTFYFVLPSLMIPLMTTLSDLWLMWQCDQSLLTLTPNILKIEKWEVTWKENKNEGKIRKIKSTSCNLDKTPKPTFIQDKIKNLEKYMKFMQAPIKTTLFYLPPYYKSLQPQGE